MTNQPPDSSVIIDGFYYVTYAKASSIMGIATNSVRQLVSNGALDGAGGYVRFDSVTEYIKNKMLRKATKSKILAR